MLIITDPTVAIVNKTFRIFVSSTFSDLKEERNALQRDVFPELKKLCMQHGYRFQAIDLRWGVREESALDQQTMNICLDEVARCQRPPNPNFIVLLGDRYGWQPLPAEIPASEFEQIVKQVLNEEDKALLKSWYKRDDNAVPAVYSLQPREVQVKTNAPDSEKKRARDEESKRWEKTETSLRRILRNAIKKITLTDDQKIKYETSATEQEIVAGALNVPDAEEHVFGFLREIEGLPQDESAEDYIDLIKEEGKKVPDTGAKGKLENLKERITENVGKENVSIYDSQWTGKGITYDHLTKLCYDMYSNLYNIIYKEIDLMKEQDPLEKEIESHDIFGRERTKFFTGRIIPLKNIKYYILAGLASNAENHPYAVFGESGSGKSALMAKAIWQAKSEYYNTCIVSRFIGATPDSTDVRAMLESLCRQISRYYGKDESDIPYEYSKLVEEFPNRLAFASTKSPLIIFIDALDQLSHFNRAKELLWLPNFLPQNVRLIVSASSGDVKQLLWNRLRYEDPLVDYELKGSRFIEVPAMQPEEGERILDQWMGNVGRTLQPNQRKEIINKFNQCKLPLYLKLAFEEARHWKSYSKKTELSSDIPGIIQDFLTRLSYDANHGDILVSRSLGYIAAAKNGLSEDELIDILSHDKEVFDDFKKRAYYEPPENQIPVVIWSRLYFDLEPYLSEHIGDNITLMGFYHDLIRKAVEQIYLDGEERMVRHRYLEHYFSNQKFIIKTNDSSIYNLRKLSELPFQQTSGNLLENLKTTFTDFYFLEAKIKTVGIEPLINDYDLALQVYPESMSLKLVRDALKLSSHVLAKDTNQLAGQLIGRLLGCDIPRIKNLIKQVQRMRTVPWLQPLTPCLIQPGGPLLRTLIGHTSKINKVSVTPDGKRVVSASDDKTLKMWNIETGEELYTLKGHSHVVNNMAITPDGRYVISASSDKTLKVWNVESAEELATLKGHTDAVNGLGYILDGGIVISVSADNTLRFWNLQNALAENYAYLQSKLKDDSHEMARATAYTGLIDIAVTPDEQSAVIVFDDKTISVWDLKNTEEIHSLIGHKGEVRNVAVTIDGRRAISASSDGTLKVWDLEFGIELFSLDCQSSEVNAVAITPDGLQAVSGQQNGTLKVWDLESGKEKATFKGHNLSVTTVAVRPGGQQLVSGSIDKTVKIWSLDSKLKPTTDIGHSSKIKLVSVSANGQRAVTACIDNTIKIWDIETGKEVANQRGHKSGVNCLALLPDGMQVISGSDDTLLKIWNIETGEEVANLKGHSSKIMAVAVTPNARRGLSASLDGELKLWDLKEKKVLATFYGDEPLEKCALTQDGRLIIAGGKSGAVYFLRFEDVDTSE